MGASLLFVGSSLAMPQYAPAPYASAPVIAHPVAHVAHPAPYVKEAPQPFAYEYGGADEYGRHFAKTEAQDENGVVQGEYRVELPDGRVQIVTYHADDINGFVADVKYEGTAIPYVAPVHAAPVHALHAAPVHALHAAPVHALHAAPLRG